MVLNNVPWLTILWAIPMLGAALVMVLPASQRTVAKWLALLISLAVLGVTLVVAVGFKPGGDQYQFVENHTWIPSPAKCSSVPSCSTIRAPIAA